MVIIFVLCMWALINFGKENQVIFGLSALLCSVGVKDEKGGKKTSSYVLAILSNCNVMHVRANSVVV